MTLWKNNYESKLISLADAASKIDSGDKIWAGGYLSVPVLFLKELEKIAMMLKGTELYSGLLTYPYEFLKPEYRGHLTYRSLFMGPLEKKFQHKGNVEIIPYHLSNVGQVLDAVGCNVMVVEVTPPNKDGFVSMGACGGMGNKHLLPNVDLVIAVVNESQPFIGNPENLLHIDDVTFFAEGHHPIAGPKPVEPSDLEISIAEHVLPYIHDGATIQIGIGTISNALGMGLKGRKNLGIHTEMFTESMMELCKSGVISGAEKNYKPNKIVAAFAAGSQELIDYIDNNPDIEIGNVVVVNHPNEIAKNNNFVSINTCIMTDLTGQIASEGVGHTQISGSGGQVDFVRGATFSNGGLSVIALSSTYKGPNGVESTICSALPAGTPVTTLRNDVHLIATEYGIVDLRGLTTKQRAEALINIAHPDFRNALRDEAITNGLCK
ncbi:4-hydroxybutyrate CoA-transferase [Photobacterium profundum]|uniref:4-hydroxybutyrate CoA-transferase n=1 Tax=Photobacterium profundum 3TCK TaxID=314280 RepID=Q1Z538_9GAMM|nr:acetyl-CoA hydrolase/transferase C-terminal domain-containing protein [Photobacterium profundum]EAS43728.1 4-hydroxybutyrate CoA-transferase [Photobacterium profundum 3TCK]PSV64098.1 4-hydroxybutyrate CoA-transferase [Photobacterium profundum]